MAFLVFVPFSILFFSTQSRRIFMRGFQKAVVAGLLLSVSAATLAQANGGAAAQKCSAIQLQQLGAQLGVARFTQTDKGVVVSAACRVWPKDTSKAIMAVAYATKEDDKKGFAVAVTDVATGKLVNLHRELFEEDAGMQFRESSLKIDTARYDLAPGVRAFAVDVQSGGPGASCPDGGSGPMRSLYVQQGEKLQKVLDGLDMASWQFVSGGPAMCLGPNADKIVTVVEEFPTTIDVASSSSNGFADLTIRMASKLDNGAKSKRKPFQHVLKFDGKRYPTEAMRDAYWKWIQ
jgi:hypothetical protein